MAEQVRPRNRSAFREAFQTQLWPVPVVGIVVAVLVGVGVPLIDAAVDSGIPSGVRAVLFSGGPDAARTVLSAVSGSLVTVTSLTFSLTVVTLQLASSQFSPRLLRTFSRDRFVHVTLAVFLATFVYTLIVLRTVRNDGDSGGAFVPEIGVTLAVLATLASVVCLVLFLAHLSSQIRVETILQRVRLEADGTIDRILEPRQDGSEVAAAPAVPPGASAVIGAATGFLASVDEEALLAAAVEAGGVLLVQGFPGSSLVAGTPLGKCWALGGSKLNQQALDRLAARVADGLQIGPERTAAQDVAFGLRQLTDVADKALSPGINDPTTAVHALGHISGVLCHALDYRLGPRLLRDDQQRVRVVLQRPGFADLLDSAIAQPRRFASDSPNTLARIAQLLREVAWRTRDDEERDAVRQQIARTRATLDSGDLPETETTALQAALDSAEDALQHRW